MINNKDKILDLILNNTLDLVAFHELDGRYIYVSPSITPLLGWTPEEVEGVNPYTLFHPDDIKRIEEGTHKDTKAGKQNNVVDYRLRCKDGTYKWVQSISQPILGDNGKPEKILTVTRDIDKFKELQLEQEFKEKVSLETEALAKVGGWEVDLVHNTVWWSQEVGNIHEVPDDYKPILEEGINFYAPEAQPIIAQAVEDGIAKGEGWDLELPIITAKGNRKYIRTIGKVMLEDGKPIRLYGAFQDITEYKNANKETELLKARLEAATKAGSVGIWDWDVINNILTWDDRMFVLYGVKREDFSGAYEAWQKGLHEEDKKPVDEAIQRALDGKEEFNIQFRVVLPNGEIRYLKGLADVVRDSAGQPIRMIGVNYDITDSINIGKDLRLSEEKFRGSFENSAGGKAIVSLEGKLTKVNQALCKMLGYTEKELLELTFQEFTHPDDLEADLNQVSSLINGERDTYQMEKRYYTKNRRIVWVILSVSIVRDEDKQPMFFISEIQDITERKTTEEQQKELVDQLIQHNLQLKEYNNIVSHNLRAPVANLDALMHILKTTEGEEKEFVSKQMDASIEKITETLDHLVEVVKIRENRETEMDELILEDIYIRVRDQLLGKIMEYNVNIETDFSEVSSVKYPKLYLESIFLNMMDNSIKYRSDKRPLKISISSTANGKYNILNFADNGLGINLDRHGSKLFKLHKTFHRHKDSKGFGLFMVKNQLEAMGGDITCESEEGVGTLFKVKLLK